MSSSKGAPFSIESQPCGDPSHDEGFRGDVQRTLCQEHKVLRVAKDGSTFPVHAYAKPSRVAVAGPSKPATPTARAMPKPTESQKGSSINRLEASVKAFAAEANRSGKYKSATKVEAASVGCGDAVHKDSSKGMTKQLPLPSLDAAALSTAGAENTVGLPTPKETVFSKTDKSEFAPTLTANSFGSEAHIPHHKTAAQHAAESKTKQHRAAMYKAAGAQAASQSTSRTSAPAPFPEFAKKNPKVEMAKMVAINSLGDRVVDGKLLPPSPTSIACFGRGAVVELEGCEVMGKAAGAGEKQKVTAGQDVEDDWVDVAAEEDKGELSGYEAGDEDEEGPTDWEKI